MFQMGLQGIGMNLGMGIGGGLFGGSGISGGMQIGAFAGVGGAGAFAGVGAFGSDGCSFSRDAMMGGASGFNHPLLSGGLGMPSCGMNNGMGMVPGMQGMQGMQNQQMMQMMMQLMMMMMQMMQQQMGMNTGMMPGMGMGMPGMGGMGMPGMGMGMPGMGGMGMPGMGMPGMGGFGMPMGMGMPGFGGGMPGFGGMPGGGFGSPVGMIPGGHHGGGGMGNVGNISPLVNDGGTQAAPGSGQAAVDLARRFRGQESWRIKGQMPNFTAAGGQTNNCADFVSSALESTGRLKGHHVNVKELERSLIKQGYVRVPAEQARPGDVWINHSRGHTELVSKAGGTATIGSNNDRVGHQVISERGKNTGSGVYYQLRKQ